MCVDSLWMECKDYKEARDELPCFTRLFYTLISPNVQASGELNSSLHVLHVFLRGFCVLWLPPPQSNEMRARLIGVSELTVGVNVSVSVSVSVC